MKTDQMMTKAVELNLVLIAVASAVSALRGLTKVDAKDVEGKENMLYGFVAALVPFLVSMYFLMRQKNMGYRLAFLLVFGLMFFMVEKAMSKAPKDSKFDEYFEDFRFFTVAMALVVGFVGTFMMVTKK